jgi:adenylosuccinate synthase
LDTFDEVRVCVGYSLNGAPLDGYPDDSELLGEITPTYVDLLGWKQEIRACRTYDQLPVRAQAVVELVEKYVGVPVSIIGVGPERDSCVVRA